MFCSVKSGGITGLEGHVIHVEVDMSNGLPDLSIVGLGDAAVREARQRVRSAIRNSGLEFPLKKTTVNLAPANLRKEGSVFDLAMAIGILGASGQGNTHLLGDMMFLGELSLDGSLRPVRGVLPIV
ncbi:MAG TPA: magnesium chelatase, partial [Clostridiales bacterium]|nr:magnesium chelatase [Clostridiales bacterium]